MYYFDLQMFADGAAGAASGSAATDAANKTGGVVNPVAGDKLADNNGHEPSTNISDPNDAGAKDADNKPVKAKFADLIKDPDYAHDLGDIVDKAVGRKHAQLKETEKKLIELRADYDPLLPALDFLRSRYGVQSNADLANKILNDDDILDAEATRHGMDVEQYRQKLSDDRAKAELMRENAELKRVQAQNTSKQQFDDAVKRMVDEANEYKKINPDFDLREESKNRQFLFYVVDCKMPISEAYNAVHINDIIHAAEERGKTAATNTIKANKQRPAEISGVNGTTVNAVLPDVTKMTREQRDELARRIKAGDFLP